MTNKTNIFQISPNIQNIAKAENFRIGDDFYPADTNIKKTVEVEVETAEIEVVKDDGLAELREKFPHCTDAQLKKAKKCAFPGTKIINIGKI